MSFCDMQGFCDMQTIRLPLQMYTSLNLYISVGHNCKFLPSFGSFDLICFQSSNSHRLEMLQFSTCIFKMSSFFLGPTDLFSHICFFFVFFFKGSLCDSAKSNMSAIISIFSSFDCESFNLYFHIQ